MIIIIIVAPSSCADYERRAHHTALSGPLLIIIIVCLLSTLPQLGAQKNKNYHNCSRAALCQAGVAGLCDRFLAGGLLFPLGHHSSALWFIHPRDVAATADVCFTIKTG